MKKVFVCIILTAIAKMGAQSYMGYVPDNYAGVQGVLYNPASIVDSRFKTDINLFSISTTAANDFYGLKLSDLLKDSHDFDKDGKFFSDAKNNAFVNVDVMGPSFMFNLAPKHSIAIFTRARGVVNTNDVDGGLYDIYKRGLSSALTYADRFTGSPNIVGHVWGEVGISYGFVLFQKSQHFLKAGVTGKYLAGGSNLYANGRNIGSNFNQLANSSITTLNTEGFLTLGGTGAEDLIENTYDYKYNSDFFGIGGDIGFVYEWRPDHEKYDIKNAKVTDNNFKHLNKYKLRLGLSITDLGAIKYKDSEKRVYDLNKSLTQQQLDQAGDFKGILDLYDSNPEKTVADDNVGLPTALHIDVDWNMYKKFYLNLSGNIGLTDRTKLNTSSMINTFLLTPRYESKWFTFALPVNYMQYSGLQAGTSFRFGPVFVGSSSILTNLISDQSKAADAFLGVKIPIYQNKFKDTDEDGIIDRKDDCPKVAGPLENKGCPWEDTDKDSVADKDDKCPAVAGPAENKGCPWEDTDGDSVLDKDDKCPREKGLLSNNGCPDRDLDNDGVLDKDDACPTVAGLVSNKGCPEVTKEVAAELKLQARSIYFVTGKSALRYDDNGETESSLVAINEIIKNYPHITFVIEGHTDNVGSVQFNQRLSEERAAVVKNALIDKGANEANLTAKGFGELKPVATNSTEAGRAKNRRVEVIQVGSVQK